MIFQNLSNILPMDIIIIICWLVVIISFVILSIFLIYKSKGKPKRIKYYLLVISIFFILYCVNRLIFFVHELTFEPNFVWSYTIAELNNVYESNPSLSENYSLYWRFATSVGSIGLLFFLIGLESHMLEKKSKFLLSIFQAIISTFSIMCGVSKGDELTIAKILLYIAILPALAVPFIYFYFAAKSKGAVRKRALGAGFGFLIFYIGIAINSSAGKNLFQFFYLVNINGILFSYILYGILVPVGLIIYAKSIKF
ncbi:MAG: hypothetical protein ACTSRI_11635 [Promethearchaeota archaeon]